MVSTANRRVLGPRNKVGLSLTEACGEIFEPLATKSLTGMKLIAISTEGLDQLDQDCFRQTDVDRSSSIEEWGS